MRHFRFGQTETSIRRRGMSVYPQERTFLHRPFSQQRSLAALRTGRYFGKRQFPVVTVVVADGRVYTVEEFAKTMVNVQAA